MVLMKKGEDTRYVADIFIPHYLSRGYEVIFPKKAVKAASEVVVEQKQEEKQPDRVAETPQETASDVTAEPEAEVTESANAEAKAEVQTVEAEPAPKPKTLKCPVCGKEYSKNAYLVKHIEKAHPDN